jgi:hypothetical protein
LLRNYLQHEPDYLPTSASAIRSTSRPSEKAGTQGFLRCALKARDNPPFLYQPEYSRPEWLSSAAWHPRVLSGKPPWNRGFFPDFSGIGACNSGPLRSGREILTGAGIFKQPCVSRRRARRRYFSLRAASRYAGTELCRPRTRLRPEEG